MWLTSFCLGWNDIYFVFVIFMDNRFIISHSPTRDNSVDKFAGCRNVQRQRVVECTEKGSAICIDDEFE